MTINSFNFKGNYKARTPSGLAITYQTGDVVFYQGKTYVATTTIRDLAPDNGSNSGWQELLRGAQPIQFYWGADVPLNPNIGDEWFNTTNGKIYKYLPDGDSQQWVNNY